MRKGILGVVLMSIMFSCTKNFVENEDEIHLAENVAQIRALNKSNNLNLTEHVSTGIFWKKTKTVTTPVYPSSDKTVHLAYTLKTLDGEVLFNVTPADSNFFGINSAANVFQGFVIAVNSLGEGEKGIFYLPSPLVFAGDPPGNLSLDPWEVTILEMELIKFYDETALIDLYITNNNLSSPELTEKGIRIIRNGTRPPTAELKAGDVVTVSYKGYFFSNVEFDKGQIDVTIGAGGVIPGFEDGLAHMRVGEKATIIIPWQYGYGSTGSKSIPPYTTLIFDLEVVSKNN
jgi:FKBP-type peptidyl-prolyl cis-trans isomerase